VDRLSPTWHPDTHLKPQSKKPIAMDGLLKNHWWLGLDRKNRYRPRQSSFFDNIDILGYTFGYTGLQVFDCTEFAFT
jgi:hypothetical protein